MNKKLLILLAALATMAAALTGCSDTTPTEFNIAYVIGGGGGDARAIKEIVMPGAFIDKESDDDNEYIYGNSRNWNVEAVQGADQQVPWSALSKPSDDGNTPGYAIEGQAITPFAVNRPDGAESCSPDSKSEPCRALFAFYQYCSKYGCQSSPDDNTETQNLSTDPGWENMLREGWAKALAHAFTTVISDYDVSVVNQPVEWPKIGKKMGELAFEEMSEIVGLPKGVHIFCNTSVIAGEKCAPPVVQFHSIASPDAQAILAARRDAAVKTQNSLDDIANQKAIADKEQELARQKAAFEQELANQPGGAEREAAQRELNKINACAASPKCVLIMGVTGSTQLQIPAG